MPLLKGDICIQIQNIIRAKKDPTFFIDLQEDENTEPLHLLLTIQANMYMVWIFPKEITHHLDHQVCYFY